VYGGKGRDSFELLNSPASTTFSMGLYGGDNNDEFKIGKIDGAGGIIDGQGGDKDFADFTDVGKTDLRIVLGAAGTVNGLGGQFSIRGIEHIKTSSGNDEIYFGLSSSNYLFDLGAGNDKVVSSGSSKDDKIIGGADMDSLEGGSGNDVLYGGESTGVDDNAADTLLGGAGYDTYYVGAQDVITDSDGRGKVVYSGRTLTGGTRQAVLDADGNDISGNLPMDQRTWLGGGGEKYKISSSGVLTVIASDGGQFTINDFDIASVTLGILLKGRFDRLDHASPLILDLDGDGIETVGVSGGGVFFDVDRDGLRERTGWVGADDGLLVLDRNLNGRIDDVTELFGYGKTVTVTGVDVTTDRDDFNVHPGIGIDDEWFSGFRALAALQTVHDGVLDSQDAVFNQLKVWRDLDTDGVTDAGELFTLADLNIASINLEATRGVVNAG
jgi:RTX calcium-binding nonapeptide repeat (4 copies)